jgi:hypothetical protein
MRRPSSARRPSFKGNNDLFGEFALAEKLGKTHAELLTGRPQPLSCFEFSRWSAYYEYVQELEKEAEKEAERKAKRKGRAG